MDFKSYFPLNELKILVAGWFHLFHKTFIDVILCDKRHVILQVLLNVQNPILHYCKAYLLCRMTLGVSDRPKWKNKEAW